MDASDRTAVPPGRTRSLEGSPGRDVGRKAFGKVSADVRCFLASVAFHVVLLFALAAIPVFGLQESLRTILAEPEVAAEVNDLKVVEDVVYAEEPSLSVGADSSFGTSMAFSTALTVGDLSEVPSPVIEPRYDLNALMVSSQLKEPLGTHSGKIVIKGRSGMAASGAPGAVDRITYEILRAMEERPTLVVWLFDRSGSLIRQREEIRNRFDKIYEELGIVQRSPIGKYTKRDRDHEPLLTSIIAFGDTVELLTKQPTADLNEIKTAVDSIELDATGIERTFAAVYLAADRYKSLRNTATSSGPARNVLLVAVTDERGNDVEQLDNAVRICQKFAIPVYVLGVPAPFGREHTYVKYVDPDPRFDQSPSWSEVDQGPESLYPERVQLGYEKNYHEEPVIDSGFGPYGLSRLCYETGGIYFTIHPNRKVGQFIRDDQIESFASRLRQFFDPAIMDRYRPDYVSEADYLRLLKASPLREALVTASRLSRTGTLDAPERRFVKRDEAEFVMALSRAQQEAARLEPRLAQLADILAPGEKHRGREDSPRWLASYDLSYGTVLAAKVRTEGYNLALAKAKRGMKFEVESNNTWNLDPSTEITGGSRLEKEAELAKGLLSNVVKEHKGTPWAYLATRELQTPMGWKWRESYTELNPVRPRQGNGGNRLPEDDRARMLNAPVKRPVPKL